MKSKEKLEMIKKELENIGCISDIKVYGNLCKQEQLDYDIKNFNELNEELEQKARKETAKQIFSTENIKDESYEFIESLKILNLDKRQKFELQRRLYEFEQFRKKKWCKK